MLSEALVRLDGDGDEGAPTIFSTARRQFRRGSSSSGLAGLDWGVDEEEGVVGVLPVLSAWTEEHHGGLATAALSSDSGNLREKGRDGGGWRREGGEKREARVSRRRGSPCSGAGQVGAGPRGGGGRATPAFGGEPR